MTKKILFIGAGAIGLPAAVLAARAAPATEITVVDAGTRLKSDRTFVINLTTMKQLQQAELWQPIADIALPLTKAEISFAGAFGRLRLAAEDMLTTNYAYSIAEASFLALWHELAAAQPNLQLVTNTAIESVANQGAQVVAASASSSFSADFVAISTLPAKTLKQTGFSHVVKSYAAKVAVASIEAEQVASCTYERIFKQGVATLVPRHGGYGHIMICDANQAAKLAAMDEQQQLTMLQTIHPGLLQQAKIIQRASFAPSMRRALFPALGRIGLIGAAACSVHPIGAQELNLGLRDGCTLAQLLSDPTLQLAGLAEQLSKVREADRQRVMTLTDRLAIASSLQIPGKLIAAGAVAAVADLFSPLRRKILVRMVMPPTS